MTNLKYCPFCGGPAELDTMRVLYELHTRTMGHEVAIYCLECSAEMSLCYADVPNLSVEEMVSYLREAWNRRSPGSPPGQAE